MRPTRLGVLAGALALATAGPTATASAPGALHYVALGDSYSSAAGVLPPDVLAPPECQRSSVNYPHVIADAIGATLVDVTCGGADTNDFSGSQFPGVAPQLEALTSGTQLVTMTIGVNDSTVFMDTIVNCGLAGLSTGGRGSPCMDKYGSSFVRTIRDRTGPSLIRALRKVHRAAPAAEVAILGYPWIMPRRVGCFDKMPVAEGDVPYLRNIQRVLNRTIRRAAALTGSTYVDFSRVSEGHDACAPADTRWIEPAAQGTNPIGVHPNARGEAEMAARTLQVLGLG